MNPNDLPSYLRIPDEFLNRQPLLSSSSSGEDEEESLYMKGQMIYGEYLKLQEEKEAKRLQKGK